MIDKEKFISDILSEKEGEMAIEFTKLDLNLTPYQKRYTIDHDRRALITQKQDILVDWCKEIPNCNWSVGFVDDEEYGIMVVKWWFNEQDYPVEVPTE